MISSKRISLFGVNFGIVIFLFCILPIISERDQVFYNDYKLPISIVVGIFIVVMSIYYYSFNKQNKQSCDSFNKQSVRYEGEWKNVFHNGKRVGYTDCGKRTYEGEWKNGEQNGKGIYYYENGKKAYEGEFKDGLSNGKGVYYYENGKIAYE